MVPISRVNRDNDTQWKMRSQRQVEDISWTPTRFLNSTYLHYFCYLLGTARVDIALVDFLVNSNSRSLTAFPGSLNIRVDCFIPTTFKTKYVLFHRAVPLLDLRGRIVPQVPTRGPLCKMFLFQTLAQISAPTITSKKHKHMNKKWIHEVYKHLFIFNIL